MADIGEKRAETSGKRSGKVLNMATVLSNATSPQTTKQLVTKKKNASL